MVWDINAPYQPEVQKCRPRLLQYCAGVGLDIGCGPEKIRPEAIGVDRASGDINCDITRGLTIFQDNSFDYVFSSHCLEDFRDAEAILADWWAKVRVGGYLVLYLPHKDHYPRIGQPGSNPAHQHDFEQDDIIGMMEQIGNWDLVRNEVHAEDDEYSFELVFKKLTTDKVTLYRGKDTDTRPRAIVIRYGAFGDHVIASPLLKRLHDDGYHITYNCTARAFPVIKNNPYIDTVLEQADGLIPNDKLDEYWKDLTKGYDKVINLSESIECKFLYAPDRPNYKDPIQKRREACGGTNYYDYTLEVGGYTDVKRPRPELYPTSIEDAIGRYWRAKHAGKFIVLWALAGSSWHKCFPAGEDVALRFLDRHPDAMTITVGDDVCRLIEWDHKRAKKKSAIWDIRTSMLATKWVDLVIAPETGILNAAGCYPTPKIGLLTHSNKTNLTKYFQNDYSMQSEIECSPCHRMIYEHNGKTDCPHLDLGDGAWLCACVAGFDPDKLLKRMEYIYATWKEKSRKVSLIRPEQAVHDFGRLTFRDILQPGRAAL